MTLAQPILPIHWDSYHYYDGYSGYYDGDGTYSYSFVTTMYDGAPRTFRISAEEEFKGWPKENLPEEPASELEDLLMLYIDPIEMKAEVEKSPHMYGKAVLSQNDEYVSVYVNPKSREAYSQFISQDGAYEETGNYLVIRYRISETFSENPSNLQVYANAVEATLNT